MILNDIGIVKSITANADDMELINQFSRRKLEENEVYTFSVILCDNEVDRDYERFTVEALEVLKELFIGKTGIFDHNPKGQNQTARVYSAEVFHDTEKRTSLDEEYVCLKAKAYILKSEKNADLILEIDGGIKKEVSVSCSVSDIKCSICGAAAKKGCKHLKGKTYDGVKCHHILENPTDAYEWSFVAVPAQKNAGVTKAYKKNEEENKMRDAIGLIKAFNMTSEEITLSHSEALVVSEHIKALEKSAKLGEAYKDALTSEVTRLSFLVNDSMDIEIFNKVAQKMDVDELKAFKAAFEKKLNSFEDNVQLKSKSNMTGNTSNSDFRI